jgi:hypothetical protein
MSEVKEFKIGSAKREEITALVAKVARPHKVRGPLDMRHTSKEGFYGAYERYLLDNGHTVFLSLETMEASVSSKPSPKSVRKFEQKEKRAEERAARKQERETKKAERAAKPKKAERKPKAEPKPKVEPVTGQAGWSNEEWARIQAIMAERKCSRSNAIKVLRGEQKKAEATTPAAQEPKKADQKPVDPLTTVKVYE